MGGNWHPWATPGWQTSARNLSLPDFSAALTDSSAGYGCNSAFNMELMAQYPQKFHQHTPHQISLRAKVRMRPTFTAFAPIQSRSPRPARRCCGNRSPSRSCPRVFEAVGRHGLLAPRQLANRIWAVDQRMSCAQHTNSPLRPLSAQPNCRTWRTYHAARERINHSQRLA